MRTFLLLASILWCTSSQATVLRDSSTFFHPTVVDDWSALETAPGEDGPIFYQGLQIESLNNRPMYQEFDHYQASPNTGFPDDSDGIVSALNANITETDFLFTFPTEVGRAGLYMRGRGSFNVLALDRTRHILESVPVELGGEDGLTVFRGFTDLQGLRSIRVTQLFAGAYSTQFDEVQWQSVPEPAAGCLLLIGMLFRFAHKARSHC